MLCARCDQPIAPDDIDRHIVDTGSAAAADVLLHRSACPRPGPAPAGHPN